MSKLSPEKLEDLKKELGKFKKGEKIQRRSRSTPLGKLFDKISKQIDGYQSQSDVINYLYTKLGGTNLETERVVKRKIVIHQLLEYLSQINLLSKKKEGVDIISIPLYDIRIVGDLVNIIIIHGIYSSIPTDFLIPLEKRKLKNFKMSTIFTKVGLDSGIPILKEILSSFTEIFESYSDLKDLILVGTGFTDTLSIAVYFTITINESEYQSYINRLEAQSSTYQLLSFYSILLKHCKSNPKYSKFVFNLLSKQLLKQNGVESLVDLALGLREDEEVDIAKIGNIVQVLLSSKPTDLNIIEYYKNIFSQIYNMLVLVNRPLMNTVLVEIITVIYRKNKRIIVDFLFSKVWNNLNPDLKNIKDESIVILTNEIDLNNSFNVCLSISRALNNTDEEILNEFFQPIIIPLWYYAIYQLSQKKDHEIVLNLLKNVIIVGDSAHFINMIISNLLDYQMSWVFDNGTNNMTLIKFNTEESVDSKENKILRLFDKIDFNIETFIKLTKKLNDSDSKFLDQILNEALNKLISKQVLSISSDIPIDKIIYLKLIQSLLETFKSEIENSPIALLIFANTYFNQYFESIESKSNLNIVENEDSDDEDKDDTGDQNDNSTENNDTLVSLIPIMEIITTLLPKTDDEKKQLINLQSMLRLNINHVPSLLKPVCEVIISLDTESVVIQSNSADFDMETVLKQLNDQTPSVRVFALDKLTKYTTSDIKNKSVSSKYTINLLLSQLKDIEPFVYLNAIKNLVAVLLYDKSFLGYTIELYYLSNKSIDEKVRIGEVLTKFVMLSGKLLTGVQLRDLVNTCINISRADVSSKQKSPSNKDIRMRMSALSLLGVICHESGYGISPYINEIADLVHGIITFEKSAELKRAAVVIINDIVTSEKGLEIIKEYGEKLQVLLEYIENRDQDLLVCQFSSDTLDHISQAFESKFAIQE